LLSNVDWTLLRVRVAQLHGQLQLFTRVHRQHLEQQLLPKQACRIMDRLLPFNTKGCRHLPKLVLHELDILRNLNVHKSKRLLVQAERHDMHYKPVKIPIYCKVPVRDSRLVSVQHDKVLERVRQVRQRLVLLWVFWHQR
jgi:hypothetical protein